MTGGRDGRVKFWDTTDLSDTTEPLKIFDLASLTPDRAIPAIRSVCFDGYSRRQACRPTRVPEPLRTGCC